MSTASWRRFDAYCTNAIEPTTMTIQNASARRVRGHGLRQHAAGHRVTPGIWRTNLPRAVRGRKIAGGAPACVGVGGRVNCLPCSRWRGGRVAEGGGLLSALGVLYAVAPRGIP